LTEPDELGRLRRLAGDIGPALDEAALRASPAAAFPAAHQELLRRLNGLTVSGGAHRLLGVRAEPHLDLAHWNEPDTWRFAWDGRVAPFVVFGETAWGEQYAYRRPGPGPELAPEVYLLESVLLGAELMAGSFEEFLAAHFSQDAVQPNDPYTVAALARLGPVPADRHWVFAPPLALGGPDTIDNVIQMRAVTAMVFAGDLALALEAHGGAPPTAVVPWVDDQGRDRLRVDY
jgi:hypothetical protein